MKIISVNTVLRVIIAVAAVAIPKAAAGLKAATVDVQ